MDKKTIVAINNCRNSVCVTKHEKKLRRYLKDLKVFYKVQHPFEYKGSFILVDIFLPQSRLVIEVDGKHHYSGQQLIDDLERDKYLTSLGLKVLRIMNDEVKEMSMEDFKTKLFCPCCNWVKR